MVIFNDMAREFQILGTQLGFDELNVLGVRKQVNKLYQRLDKVIRAEFLRIAQRAYADAMYEAQKTAADTDDFDALTFVMAMLRAYDPLSDFVYTREYLRKRDRLFESIIATQRGNQEMRKNLKRGLDVLANQVRQYADNITIGARLQAFSDAGVEYVRWVAEIDDRTCKECWDRDGRIYRIDEVPMIPSHYHCRCRIEKANEEEYLAQQAA